MNLLIRNNDGARSEGPISGVAGGAVTNCEQTIKRLGRQKETVHMTSRRMKLLDAHGTQHQTIGASISSCAEGMRHQRVMATVMHIVNVDESVHAAHRTSSSKWHVNGRIFCKCQSMSCELVH